MGRPTGGSVRLGDLALTTLMMVTCAARADRVVYLRDGLFVDERALGAWQPADTSRREDELLSWLRHHDF